MKTSAPPPAVTVRSNFWRSFAIASVALNVALIVWVGLATGPAPREAVVAKVAPLPASAEPTLPRPAPPAKGVAVRATGPYAALGSFMAENNRIPDLGWTEPQFAAFLDGFRASFEGRGLPLDEDAKKLRDDISVKVQAMLAREQPNPAEEYFRTLREKEGVSRTASGLHYRITEEGFGEKPGAGDTVIISFAARLPDGRELPPLTRTRVKMMVRDLLPGLAEGVQLLKVGGKALVYLPPALAFSEENWPSQIPKGMPLAFFVELHEVNPPKEN